MSCVIFNVKTLSNVIWTKGLPITILLYFLKCESPLKKASMIIMEKDPLSNRLKQQSSNKCSSNTLHALKNAERKTISLMSLTCWCSIRVFEILYALKYAIVLSQLHLTVCNIFFGLFQLF